ncbi:MAG: PQQ-dependent sugar dehydrogenase [bacterium]
MKLTKSNLVLLVTVLVFTIQLHAGTSTGPTLVKAFPNLRFTQPLFLTHANDGSGRLFVVQQNGFIKVFENSPEVTTADDFLNIQSKITTNSEMGLLGLAFHPDFAENDSFYVNYTQGLGSLRKTVVARYTVLPGQPNQADASSERVLLEVRQPFSNHNGGMLAFGPDNYLYIGLGDGGSAGDPIQHGQNRATLLGSILRIDVDAASAGRQYGIPEDNPFAGNTDGFREEIFAWGFRNPWRFSFDFQTGQIWAGDVGQNRVEEIDLVEKGKNYGWRIMEGTECFNPNNPRAPLSSCDQTGLTLPVTEQVRSSGGASITGGYVYRGQARPELQGAYIYGDFETGDIRLLRYESGQVTVDSLLLETDFLISSFGVDEQDELYVVDYLGEIYKFEANPVTGVQDLNPATPNSFTLAQNYPNPFNPTTTIAYSLSSPGRVKLEIFNFLGQKIKTLVDGIRGAGEHQVQWRAENDLGEPVANGVYLYQLRTGNLVQTRKLIYLK